MSFDVINVYPSIPISEEIEIMADHVRNNGIHADIADESVSLLEVCLKNNMCVFD